MGLLSLHNCSGYPQFTLAERIMPSYSAINFSTRSKLTPLAAKLYEVVAGNGGASLDTDAFLHASGADPDSEDQWLSQLRSACRELVANSIVKSAQVADGKIVFEI